MSKRPSRLRRKATTIVEFAFIVVVFFMFLFGVIEYGRFIMTLQLMNNAAREGARAAVVGQSSLTTAQIEAIVTNYLGGQSTQLTGMNIQVYQIDPSTGGNIGSWNSAGFGQAIAVQINGDYSPALPSFLQTAGSIPVQVCAVMYSEAD